MRRNKPPFSAAQSIEVFTLDIHNRAAIQPGFFDFSRGLKLVLGVVGVLVWSVGFGQVTIMEEDFEDANVLYTTTVPEFTDGSYDYFTRTDGNNIGDDMIFSNIQGTSFFAAHDIDDGTLPHPELNFSSIDISGYTGLELSLFIAEDDDGINKDWDDNDFVHINYRIDSGLWTQIIWIENPGDQFNENPFIDNDFDGDGDGAEITDSFTEYIRVIPETGTTLDIQFVFNLDSGDEDIAIDDIKVIGTNPTACNIMSSGISGTNCNDNSTPLDPSDDFINFNLSPTGINLDATTFNVSVSSGTITPSSGTYGSANNFVLQDGSAGAGNITVTIEDDTDSSCQFDQLIIDPGICSVYPEPSNHPTSFQCEGVDIDEIYIEWVDVATAPLPTGYLIVWAEDNYTNIPIEPTDGTPIPNGPNSLNVSQGNGIAAIQNLETNTPYFFKIYAYTNTGTDISYKTDEIPVLVESTSCNTLDGPCIDEEFDNGNTTPSGWTFSGIGEYQFDYGASAPSVKFDDDNDEILTNVSASSASEISFWIKGQGTNSSSSSLLVEGFNGSTWQTIDDISSIPNSEATYTYNFLTIPALLPNLIQFRFTYSKSSGNLAFDDLIVLCTEACIPTQTISSFTPIEGPEGTLITVNGTGFDQLTTPITDVLIGGNSTIYSVENDTTIQILIDDIPLNGLVSVIVDGCEVESINSFSYMDHNGNCSNSVGGGEGTYSADLFISQVYDSFSGSLSYIEVFNGTENPVDLDAGDYAIVIETGATVSFDMSGTLGVGDVYLLKTGTGTICSGVTPNQSGTAGFNGNDEIFLLKASVVLDYAPNPEAIGAPGSGTGVGEADEGSGAEVPGFAQWRNEDAIAPNYGSYDSDNWSEENTQNCEGINEPPYIPDGKNITINTQPADVDCDSLIFTVDAISTENGPSFEPADYVWRYIAPGDLTWSLVSALGGSNGISVVGSGNDTIIITGNTSILFDYQFYVEIQTGGSPECKKFSNVATYTFDTKAYYQTKQAGLWSALTTWEMADDEGGPYTFPVCQYPVDRTSDKISILHDVDLDVEIGVDWVVVSPTSTLSLADSTELTIYDGNPAGPDLVVNGTLIDNGNSANGVDFYNDLSTWEMTGNATLIKTSSSFATRYRDAYHNGIINIPDTVTWIYRYINNGILSFANSAIGKPMYYPNLILENMDVNPDSSRISDGSPNLSAYTITGGEPLTIKGDFNVGGSGTSTINFSNINTNALPVLVQGELIVQAGSTLRNTGGDLSNFGTGIEVQQDLTINGTLDLSAGTGTNKGILKLSGDFDVIGLGGTTVLANNFIMDKGTGRNGLVDLGFDIKENAQFLNGILELTAPSNFFNFQATATTTGASNTSFVDGPVRKTTDLSTNFTFPIGDSNTDGSFYQPARIFDNTTGTGIIQAQYFIEEHPFAGDYYDGESNNTNDNHEIGNCDYWSIDSISGNAFPKLALAFSNPNLAYCNQVDDSTHMVIASQIFENEWEPTDSSIPTNSDEILMDVTIGTAITGGSFGDFAFSSSGSNLNVLPIELTYFQAKALESTVMTRWQTSTETDNDYFSIERSRDTEYFEEVGRVDGAGISHSALDYHFEDLQPYPGISYYRLKQTDFNGAFKYSDIQSVEFEGSDAFKLINAYRSGSDLQLQYISDAPYLVVEIFDALGQRLFGDIIENYGSGTAIYPNLQRGAYVVRLSHGSDVETRKFVW